MHSYYCIIIILSKQEKRKEETAPNFRGNGGIFRTPERGKKRIYGMGRVASSKRRKVKGKQEKIRQGA